MFAVLQAWLSGALRRGGPCLWPGPPPMGEITPLAAQRLLLHHAPCARGCQTRNLAWDVLVATGHRQRADCLGEF